MNLNRHLMLIGGVILALAGVAKAQDFTGAVGIQEDTSQNGAYAASSLTMDISNYTEPSSATGTFLATVPNGTEVFAYGMTISNLSSSPQSVPISDFLIIGAPGPGVFGSPGTTPNDRFDFDLLTLEQSSPTNFIGTGTLVDTQGDYASTPAQMLLNFSGVNNYSFTLAAVPEPATISLVATSLLGVLAFRHRKV